MKYVSARVKVICRDCGKVLLATSSARQGWHVRKHKRPDLKPCRGHLGADHERYRIDYPEPWREADELAEDEDGG